MDEFLKDEKNSFQKIAEQISEERAAYKETARELEVTKKLLLDTTERYAALVDRNQLSVDRLEQHSLAVASSQTPANAPALRNQGFFAVESERAVKNSVLFVAGMGQTN